MARSILDLHILDFLIYKDRQNAPNKNASVFRFLCAKFNSSTLQKSQQFKTLHSFFLKKKSCNLFYMRKQYVLALMTEFCV